MQDQIRQAIDDLTWLSLTVSGYELERVLETIDRFRNMLEEDEQPYFFEGICEGTIIDAPRGDGGFGYDPVFIPDGAHKTFAEMTMEEKNEFSHRKKATEKFVEFLKNYHGKD